MAPTDVPAFFSSYTTEIVHLAAVAQEGGVTTFAIGNEMSSLSGPQYASNWVNLILQVRQVYHGQLTYSAAIDEASHVSFWGQLDTIGVNTYPPLTSSETPTVQELVNAWSQVPFNPYYAAAFNYQSPVDFLHSLALQYGKPVLITEVGYLSVGGTAINPGSTSGNSSPDPAAQADAYNALFQVWSAEGGSWLQGVELWQWDLDNVFDSTGYSVMGKPAATIVSQYFHGAGIVPALTIVGTPVADNLDLGGGNDVVHTGLGNDVISGGAGNDTIVAGPESLAALPTTTITLTGYGSTVDGVGAQAQILVNGKVISGLLEFKPATDPSGYQTFTITFANSEPTTSLDISLANSIPGRSLHLKDITVNGVELTPTQGTNASSPGSFDLYVRTIHFDTTKTQAWFTGATTDNDLVHGGAGNDVITGGTGTDYLDGGAGTDTAVYAGNRSDYTISVVGNQVIVIDNVAGRDGTDYLSNIELLKFANTTISTASLPSNHTELSALDLRRVESTDSQSINSDGSINSVEYDSDGHIVQFATRYTDGSFDQLTFDTSGAETGKTIRHADGLRDIYNYDAGGQNSISQHVTIDAWGHSVSIEQLHADGTPALRQTVDVKGVKTLDQYDSLGHIAEQAVTQKDGSYVQSSYASNGALIAETTRRADGGRNVDTWGIAGQAYSARQEVIDASGHTVATTFDNTNGSQTMAADAAGVTLTSTAVNDIMNSAGGDTFVFKQASGNVVINNFKAGDAVGHDVIQIASSLATDLAHLTIEVVGQDTVIEFGHDASITLTGVVTPLTAHDVLIV